MPAVRSITVHLPILNGARYLDRVLGALARQDLAIPWDFLALDCGSTDGTLAIFERHAQSFPVPLRVRAIGKGEFNHGCTRNMLASLSRGELLVFITDDAIPMRDDWLACLARNFEDPRVAAAYCRNVTRPEADVLVRLGNEHDPAYGTQRREHRIEDREAYARMGPEERRLFFNYCDTASAMRRELWERHPYVRCTFAEDVMQAKAFLEAGYTVVFDVDSPVEHSHDFDLGQAFARSAVDGECNAELLGRLGVPTEKVADRMARRQSRSDLSALRSSRLSKTNLIERFHASRKLRRAQFRGMYEGSRSLRRWRYSALLERPDLVALVLVGSGASEATRDYAGRLAAATGELGMRTETRREAELEADARGLLAGPDLVHVHSPGRSTLPLLGELVSHDVPLLVHYHDASEAQGDPEVLYAGRCAALALAGDAELHARMLARAGYHPVEIALSPRQRAGVARDLSEHAREIAFRYRQVACKRGQATPDELWTRRTGEANSAVGDVRAVGLGAAVLGPGHGAVEFVLPSLPSVRCDLILRVGFTGQPKGERPAGRVLAGRRPIARFGPLQPLGPDDPRLPFACGETRVLGLGLRDAGALGRLRIENRTSELGSPHPLRLESVSVQARTIDTRRAVDGLGKLPLSMRALGRVFEVVPSMGS